MKKLITTTLLILSIATIVKAGTIAPIPFLSRVSNLDTTPGYLETKLVAGSNVTITKNNAGANETLTISSTGGGGGSSLATSTIWTMFENQATGLTYNKNTGTTTLTAGYVIPLSASTTQWSSMFNYGTSTFLTSSSLTPYMTLAYGSSTYLPLASSSLFYLATNPSGYITNTVSNLTNYPTFTYASTTFPSFSYASSTFASTSWITSSFPTFSYASSTFASTSWVVNTFAPKVSPTFTGVANFVDATFSNSTSSKLFFGNASSTGGVTATNFFGNLIGNATNVTGTVGVTNGGTGITTHNQWGIVYSQNGGTNALASSVALQYNSTVNGGTLTTPSFLFTNATGTNIWSNLYPTGLSNSFLAVDVNGKIIATTTPSSAPGSGNSAFTIGNGLIYNATSTDNVGIGTTTPSQRLSVNGNLHVASTSLWNFIVDASNGRVGIGTTTGVADLSVIATNGHTNPVFQVASSSAGSNPWLTIASNGQLGIGTDQPAGQLHVNYGNGTVASTTAIGNGGVVEFGANFNTPYISSGEYQNFLLQTEDFSNASWIKYGVGSVTANNVMNPQNLLIAERIPAGTTATSGVYQTTGNNQGGIFAFSVWLKSQQANATTSIGIDWINGTATTTGTYKVLNLTPVWQRYYVVQDTGVSARTLLKANIYNGTSVIAAWGAQLEATTTKAYSGPQTTASSSALSRRNRFYGATVTDGALTVAGALSGVTTLSMGGALSGVTTAALSGTLTQTMTSLATTTNSVPRGYYGVNSTAATITQNQQSPAIELEGKVWSGGASVPAAWRVQTTFPATSTTFGTSSLDFTSYLNNRSTSTVLSLKNSGLVGIGTTTQAATLTVQGTSSNPTADLFRVASSSGTVFASIASNGTLTMNGAIKNRVVGYASNASTTINCDTTDVATTTITASTTIVNFTGTPYDGQMVEILLMATTSKQLWFGTNFGSSTDLSLPTTIASGTMSLLFQYDLFRAKWWLLGLIKGLNN